MGWLMFVQSSWRGFDVDGLIDSKADDEWTGGILGGGLEYENQKGRKRGHRRYTGISNHTEVILMVWRPGGDRRMAGEMQS